MYDDEQDEMDYQEKQRMIYGEYLVDVYLRYLYT
jgi:hypothetical protein